MTKNEVTKSPPRKPAAPDHLTMRLSAPGMSLLHRAGLCGLACTLRAMERQHATGLLPTAKLPAPLDADARPWEIDEQTVTLNFGKPENAGEYLKKLFAFAFQIRDGVIYLPGQYSDVPPSLPVRAELQKGLLLTLYDHGPKSRSVREVTIETMEVDERTISYPVARLNWYKHQRDGADLATLSLTRRVPVSRMLLPGAIVRHDSFKVSAVEEGADILVPLLFAPVGVFALRMGAKKVTIRRKRVLKPGGVLVIPGFSTLANVHNLLPILIPFDPQATRIGSMSDAILAAEVRLHTSGKLNFEEIASFRSIWCCAADWQSQLQPPSAVIEITAADTTDRVLQRYARAAASLPTRVRSRVVQETVGRGKSKVTTRRDEYFLSDSIVRPLIAENLARGHKWYSGFVRLITKINPATDKPYRNQLFLERGGLHAMITDDTMWETAGERIVVEAVHEALRGRYAQIADENKNNPVAMHNRFGGEYDRWRLAFGGAKTPDQFRKAICDLFSRAGRNAVLQKQWQEVLPMLRANTWQHARDLALLALCSYQGRGAPDADGQESNPK